MADLPEAAKYPRGARGAASARRLEPVVLLIPLVTLLSAPPAPARYSPVVLGQQRRFGMLSPFEKRSTAEPITLNLKDADLVDVLQHVGKMLARNIVIDPGIRGSVTVTLHDVPADHVFDLLLTSHGLAAVREGNVIVVGSAQRLADW